MLRLGIEYHLPPRESEILHLEFWDLAFEQLKAKSVLYFETEGKNKDCWVMKRGLRLRRNLREEFDAVDTPEDGPDEDAKVIVRSTAR